MIRKKFRLLPLGVDEVTVMVVEAVVVVAVGVVEDIIRVISHLLGIK
jgi:hypothetical protein